MPRLAPQCLDLLLGVRQRLLGRDSHAAIRAVQYFPEVRQWFQRWKRKKPIRVARALVAKELAKSVYVVLSQGVEFDQQFKGTPLTKRKQASWPRRASPSA